MRRLLSIICVLTVCIAIFAACGEEDIGGSVVSTPASKVSEPVSSAPVEAAPEEETAEEFSSGIVIGGTYTNEFIGISCTLDENWMFFDEAQLAEINGLAAEAITDEELSKQLEESGVIYDMYAMTLDGYHTININLENLGLIYGTLLSESDYAEIALQSLPTALSSAGFVDPVCEQTTVTFAGEEHAAINISATIQELPIYETLVCIKAGDYMACVTFASYVENDTAELMEFFSAVE